MTVIHDLFEQIQLKMFSNRLKRLHFSRKRKLQHVIKLRLLTDKSALIKRTNFRLTFVAQNRRCLNSLVVNIVRVHFKKRLPHW